MMKNLNVWLEVVMMAAMAMVISFIPTYIAPIGVDISIAMVPIVVLGLRRGLVPAVAAGFVWGILNVALGTAFIFSLSQTLIEYFVAFTFGGMAGLFMNPFQSSLNREGSSRAQLWIVFSTFTGVAARFFWHFIAGILFFGANAPEGTPVWMYSLAVNGMSAILTSLAVILILLLIYRTSPKLFQPKN